jgi:hypothetical protein
VLLATVPKNGGTRRSARIANRQGQAGAAAAAIANVIQTAPTSSRLGSDTNNG